MLRPWFDKNDTKLNNEKARNAYSALLTVTPEQPSDIIYEDISNKVCIIYCRTIYIFIYKIYIIVTQITVTITVVINILLRTI